MTVLEQATAALRRRPDRAARRLVGLKIGGSQLAAARVVNAGGAPELVQLVREPLEPGIVVGGEVRDPERLAAALRDFFKKHGLPRKGIRVGVASNRIGVRSFELGGIVDPKQLDNAIRFHAQEVLPIPLEEAVLDYHVLGDTVTAAGEPAKRILLVVAYRDLVDRYVEACTAAGLELVGIDLEAFALLRALSEPREPGDGTGAVVAVSVGHERSTFAVSDGRHCEFTRVLEWGGSAVNVAIARALDRSPAEVEELKRSLSLEDTAAVEVEGFTPAQVAEATEAVRKQLQTFARELVSSLQFYQHQPGSLGIAELVVTGGGAHLPGFADGLERLIGVPVREGDPLRRVKVSKRVGEQPQVGSLAVAIGLGIDD
jgi:type IV pilus assembly protein PilM